jgi:hypothetical protein
MRIEIVFVLVSPGDLTRGRINPQRQQETRVFERRAAVLNKHCLLTGTTMPTLKREKARKEEGRSTLPAARRRLTLGPGR